MRVALPIVLAFAGTLAACGRSPGSAEPLWHRTGSADCASQEVHPPIACVPWGRDGIVELCAVDSCGNAWEVSDREPATIPAGAWPGLWVRFAHDPDPAALRPDVLQHAVRIYTAPVSMESERCCPEDDPRNQVPAEAMLFSNGGLLVSPTEVPAAPIQVSFVLDYALLFPAGGSGCEILDRPCAGLTARLYRGGDPEGSGR